MKSRRHVNSTVMRPASLLTHGSPQMNEAHDLPHRISYEKLTRKILLKQSKAG